MAKKVKEQAIEIKTEEVIVQKPMVEKVTVPVTDEEDSFLARIIGIGLIVLGALFIILAVVVVYLSRQAPKFDGTLSVPTIEAENKVTNSPYLKVSGKADPNSTVVLYLDGQEQERTFDASSEGSYQGEVEVGTEKEYRVEAAMITGFPIRKISGKSDTVAFKYDVSPPSTANVEINYDPISRDGMFDISGRVEPGSDVILRSGNEKFTAEADGEGRFEIKDVMLNSKSTEFDMSLSDDAGNEVELKREIIAEFPAYAGDPDQPSQPSKPAEPTTGSGTGSPSTPTTGTGSTGTNGGEVVSEIPEASGSFEDAMAIVQGNQLMSAFGLIALGVLALNTGAVMVKVRRA